MVDRRYPERKCLSIMKYNNDNNNLKRRMKYDKLLMLIFIIDIIITIAVKPHNRKRNTSSEIVINSIGNLQPTMKYIIGKDTIQYPVYLINHCGILDGLICRTFMWWIIFHGFICWLVFSWNNF